MKFVDSSVRRAFTEVMRWKKMLAAAISAEEAEAIDKFETQIALRKRGAIEEKLFAETRLRMGVYGQRYDNGKRHDGTESRELAFASAALTKGPDTMWDAPGMQRIKVPMGRLTADQLDVLAEVAEEYSDSILHVTTRQDIQLHFVHIDDTPDMMRRLAAVGITCREACGNVVRNVTACQYAGVCSDQAFDVTPYARALTEHLLGHKDTQDFGRKFKIAFSGCAPSPCGLANFHDLGAIATIDESGRRGFRVVVGGGLGAVPQQAKLLAGFVPEAELLPTAQAVCRVFARLGERKNRARARLKFVVQKLGIEEFRRVVAEEREAIPAEEAWTAYLGELQVTDDIPSAAPRELRDGASSPEFRQWQQSNCRPQKQPGYSVATIRLPLGDFTSSQARQIADLARQYCGDTIRLSVEQNICLRWVPDAELPSLHRDLALLNLGDAGASELGDIVACPGTDTCKLGISSSRGLAGELGRIIAAKEDLAPEVRALHIKASGCFNSCSQHHVADIGFLGVSRNVGGRKVAHFQLVVGGEWANNGGSFGLAIGAFPSKRIPEVVERLTDLWMTERRGGERLQPFIRRFGRAKIKAALEELRAIPAYEDDPSFYRDWADAREYTIGDLGVGECAGEVVTFAEFGLADSERELFEAQLELDAGNPPKAAKLAYGAMLSAAQALVRTENIDVGSEPDSIVSEFRARFHETKVFWDPFAKAKFANYLFATHKAPPNGVPSDVAHRHIEEAQLFIEAAHACYDRIQEANR